MKRNLFLDDIRIPKDVFNYIENSIYLDSNWYIVRNYNDFKDYIESYGLPNLISFDHDLGDKSNDEKTGYDCSKWLVEYCVENDLDLPDFLIHSMNPIGSQNIFHYLNNYKKYRNG